MSKTFTLDVTDVDEFAKDLKKFAARSFPVVSRNTLNTGAKKTRDLSKRIIRDKMVTRNKWTEGSVRVTKAKGRRIDQQAAHVGSVMPYMATQEFGGVKTKKGGSTAIPLPTTQATHEGRNVKPRRRLPRGNNNLASIRLQTRQANRNNSRSARIYRTIKRAIVSGNRYIYLDLGKTKGIFRVYGGTRRNVSRARLRMMFDLSRPVVTIPANPWLSPAVDAIVPLMPTIYAQQIQDELRRTGTFRPR